MLQLKILSFVLFLYYHRFIINYITLGFKFSSYFKIYNTVWFPIFDLNHYKMKIEWNLNILNQENLNINLHILVIKISIF